MSSVTPQERCITASPQYSPTTYRTVGGVDVVSTTNSERDVGGFPSSGCCDERFEHLQARQRGEFNGDSSAPSPAPQAQSQQEDQQHARDGGRHTGTNTGATSPIVQPLPTPVDLASTCMDPRTAHLYAAFKCRNELFEEDGDGGHVGGAISAEGPDSNTPQHTTSSEASTGANKKTKRKDTKKDYDITAFKQLDTCRAARGDCMVSPRGDDCEAEGNGDGGNINNSEGGASQQQQQHHIINRKGATRIPSFHSHQCNISERAPPDEASPSLPALLVATRGSKSPTTVKKEPIPLKNTLFSLDKKDDAEDLFGDKSAKNPMANNDKNRFVSPPRSEPFNGDGPSGDGNHHGTATASENATRKANPNKMLAMNCYRRSE